MRKKVCIFTVAFAVVMVVATGQRGFADYSKLDQSATGLSSIVNSTFGLTGANALGSNADLVDRFSTSTVNGTFNLNGTQVYQLTWNTTSSMLGFDGNSSSFNSAISGFHWISGSRPLATTPPLISALGSSVNPIVAPFTVDGQFGFSIRTFDQMHSSLIDFGSGSGSTVVSGNYPGADYYTYFDVTSLLGSYFPGYNAYLVGFQDSQMSMSGVYGFNSATFLVLEQRGGGGGPDPSDTPEPATMLLWTLGSLSLAGASWRRNKKKLLAA